MKDYIAERVVDVANYIIESGATIRETANHFRVGKSTVHKDVHERLIEVKPQLVNEVYIIINANFEVKHIRGGAVTKHRYGRGRN